MDCKTKESKDSYNKKAREYEQTPEGKFTLAYNQYLCERVSLKAGDRILDVACGNGRLLRMITKKTRVEAYGIDISDEMVRVATDENRDISFAVAQADQTAFADDFFDVITVCCAFHHFVDPDAFMKEAFRILKPEGKLYIADPTAPWLIRLIENIIFPLSKMGDVKIYQPKEMKVFFDRAGFRDFSCRSDGYKMMAEGCRT